MIRKRLNRNIVGSAIVDLPEINNELENLKGDVNTNREDIAQIESEIGNFYSKSESDAKYATIAQIDEANTQIHQNQQDIDTIETKLNNFIKTKTVLLNDATSKAQWTIERASRTYRYDFNNLGIDKSKVIGIDIICNTDNFGNNISVASSFVWTNNNTLVVILNNVFTQGQLLDTYNAWSLNIKYME